jgi:hypothetical protein
MIEGLGHADTVARTNLITDQNSSITQRDLGM